MKTLFTFVLLTIALPTFAQKQKKPKEPKPTLELDSVSSKYIFARVVVFDSTLDAGTIFDRALQWVPRAYRDANTVIQYQDRALGKIIVKGYVREFGAAYWHTVIIECRTGRMRYTFTDFTWIDTTTFGALHPIEIPAEAKGMLQKGRRKTYASNSEKFGKHLETSISSTTARDSDRW